MNKYNKNKRDSFLKLQDYNKEISSNENMLLPLKEVWNTKITLEDYPGLMVIKRFFEDIGKELQESEQLTQEQFEKKYKNQIEKSTFFGKNGWVISPHTGGRDLDDWEKILFEQGEEGIGSFFENDEFNILNKIVKDLENVYKDGPEKLYFSEGIKHFYKKDYTAAAMFLLGVLDYRYSSLIQIPNKCIKAKEKYSKKGISLQKEKDFNQFTENDHILSKIFYVTEWYPSLVGYMQRTFVDEERYQFKTKNEPPYLNRNWLLHGRMNRVVKRYECIQIINALDLLETMFKEYAEKNELL